MINVEDVKKEINELLDEAKSLAYNLDDNISKYSNWLSRASEIVRHIIPERYEEFMALYRNKDNEKAFDLMSYLTHPERYDLSSSECLFELQVGILSSCNNMIDPFYKELSSIVYFEYQEDELSEAVGLLNINLRAAGVIAGVVLEKHLKRLCHNHNIDNMSDKTLGALITTLYANKIININTKKKLDYLAGLRNTCSHAKEIEPTLDDVETLISETRKCITLID